MEKQDIIEYVADMTRQLAALCHEHLPDVSKLLEVAANLSRDAIDPLH